MSATITSQSPTLPELITRRIALPTEHGGWGFLLEPLVAGLVVAYSAGGAWIAVMTVGAFLTRQPLKVLILNRIGLRDRRRAAAASQYVLLYSAVCGVGLARALLTADISSLTPFLFVLPLAAIQNYYDIFRRSRHLVPEIAGAIAISSSVSVIALAGGLPIPSALALWAVFVARLISSILYVRERLLLEKGKQFSLFAPIAANAISLALIVALAYFTLLPILTIAAMMLLVYRAAVGLSPRRTRMKAMKIGMLEVIYGLLLVLSIIVGRGLGF